MKQGVVRGLVPRNVAEGASRPRVDQKDIQVFTLDEVRRFLKAAKQDRLEALFVLAVTCGCRQAELLAFRWEDADLGAARLTVRRQVQRSRGDSGMIIGPTKNKKSRTIRLTKTAIEALKAHRVRQARDITSRNGFWKDPDLVFTSTIGTLLDPSNVVSRSFKPLLRSEGLPNIRFRNLRHACATLLLSDGVPVKVIQEILGHSSVTVTMDVYSHVLPAMQEKAASAMDALLS